MARRHRDREIDLGRVFPTDDLEVLELDPERSLLPPPLHLFAGLDEPIELPYAHHPEDRIGSAGLWRAIASL
jgi:hypothetical protein